MTDITNNIRTLADRAMLVRLSRGSIRTTLRDRDLEDHVRVKKDTLVRQLLRAANEVYRLHMETTLPWVDRGPRMIRNDQYLDYMHGMRNAIAEVDALRRPVVKDWQALVDEDIAFRGAGSVADYPSIEDVGNRLSFDVQVMPLPTVSDFRVDVDDETRRGLERALEDAEGVARRDVMQRMLEPLQPAGKHADGCRAGPPAGRVG